MTDLAFELGYLGFFGALLPGSVECPFPVLLQFPTPAVQIAGMHLQCPSYLGGGLSTVEAVYGCLPKSLLNFLRDFIVRITSFAEI